MKFFHLGIKCSDQEASLKFYTEVMGFEKLYELEVLGAPCIFVGNDTVEIELERSKSGNEPPQGAPEYGLSHFALESEDIEAEAKSLLEKGAQFLISPFSIRPTRKIAFVKAPDGVLIQLIQDFPEEAG